MVKRIISCFICLATLISCLQLLSCSSGKTNAFSFYALDTVIEISVESLGKERDEKIISLIKETVSGYENVFSRTKTNSEVYKINNSEKTEFKISDDLREVIAVSLDIAEKSGGTFDFTCGALSELWQIGNADADIPSPDEIENALSKCGYGKVSLNGSTLTRSVGVIMDFGAVAKGYIAEKLTGMLKDNGVSYGILSLGGNISVFGDRPGKDGYNIGVKNPYGDGIRGYVSVDCGYVSVCGTYERNKTVDGVFYHHVFDMETGYPSSGGIVSVLMVSENGAQADALSTALLVMGETRAENFIESHGTEMGAVFFFDDQRIKSIGNVNYTKG